MDFIDEVWGSRGWGRLVRDRNGAGHKIFGVQIEICPQKHETQEQLMTYTRQQLLQMNQDQLSSMLEKGLLVTSLNAQRNMLKDNNSAITKAVETKWNVLQ